MKFRNILFFVLVLFLFSCNNNNNEFKIATLEQGTTYHKNGVAISEILKGIDIDMQVLDGKQLGSFENCRMLWSDEVDFAISQNDIKVLDFLEPGMTITDSKIRTVMPLYPEVLYIIHHDSLNPKSLRDLIVGNRIGLGPENSGTSSFFIDFLNHFGIDTSLYTIVHTPWTQNVVSSEIDVSVMLAGIHVEEVSVMLEAMNCQLFKFPDIQFFEKGSSVDGFCMNYKAAHPFIIPKNTFGTKPLEPVLTIAIDAVLLCHRDIDEMTIYNICEEIYSQKNILAEMDPLLAGITDNYDENLLSFPLHEGAKKYIERNKPSFFERYAELFGVVLSIIIAIVGALMGLSKILRRKKKNRVDVYYSKLMEIEKQFDNDNSNYSAKNAISDIKAIKEEAIQLLIDEKLSANESFNIFLNLCETLTSKILNNKDEF